MDSDLPTFPEFNPAGGALCPVCHTTKNVETYLVPIPGTERDGLIECQQIHKKCFNLIAEMNSES